MNSRLSVPLLRLSAPMLLLAAVMFSGCSSQQDLAIKQAQLQADASKQAQQVVSVDKNGTTTTSVVQPSISGQANAAITTVVTPHTVGTPMPTASLPIVSAVPVDVSIPAGTSLTIRTDQNISVKNNRAGDTFTGQIVEPVLADNAHVLIPKGARVVGVVDVSHQRGHFKGRSYLGLSLVSLTLNGKEYSLTTRNLTRTKKGKGKRSTAMIAGGAGLGMLVGGLASGGTGVAVGGLIGGGAGTAVAGLTGNRDLDIPAESVIHFKLADILVVRITP